MNRIIFVLAWNIINEQNYIATVYIEKTNCFTVKYFNEKNYIAIYSGIYFIIFKHIYILD